MASDSAVDALIQAGMNWKYSSWGKGKLYALKEAVLMSSALSDSP